LRRIRRVPARRLVFLDESGSHIGMTRTYARSLRGKRVVGRVPRSRGTVTTMLGALRHDGISAIMTTEGATTGEVFTMFVKHALAPTLRRGDVVVLDNLGAHKVRPAHDEIRAKGAQVIFLPPYHPDLNPIEHGWSKLKEHLRSREPRSIPKLDRAIAEGIDEITPSDARGWFHHCGYQLY
jgi:transposase